MGFDVALPVLVPSCLWTPGQRKFLVDAWLPCSENGQAVNSMDIGGVKELGHIERSILPSQEMTVDLKSEMRRRSLSNKELNQLGLLLVLGQKRKGKGEQSNLERNHDLIFGKHMCQDRRCLQRCDPAL